MPQNPAQSAQLERQHIELFVEQAPDERTGSHATLEAAIEAHEAEFGAASQARYTIALICTEFFRNLLGDEIWNAGLHWD